MTVRSMRWNNLLIGGVTFVVAIAAAQAPASFVHRKKYVMGTVFEIVAYGESPAQTSDAIDQAFQEIVRLDNVMSDYKSGSDLSRLNRSASLQPQPVPPDLYRVIAEALFYARLSGGKFDVTVGPLVDLWKAVLRGERAPAPAEEARLRGCVGYQNVELLPPDRIRFRSPCFRIDLGGIGKGYALDRAADVLRSRGISCALLNAGGSSIYAMGAPPGQAGWLVHLRDPSNRIDPQVTLSDSSISTSEQTPPSLLSRESAGHIIDPGTGMPLQTQFAVSSVAKTATASDALSTTLLLLGPVRGAELVNSVGGVAAVWVSAGGQSKLASSGPRIVLPALAHSQPNSGLAGNLASQSGVTPR
ncbi:MAG TPA: FAD:protein FMN transferase [Terriglobales bacterium]|nr:FAD:protein FMN transferase [Terriglobales bacterium]